MSGLQVTVWLVLLGYWAAYVWLSVRANAKVAGRLEELRDYLSRTHGSLVRLERRLAELERRVPDALLPPLDVTPGRELGGPHGR